MAKRAATRRTRRTSAPRRGPTRLQETPPKRRRRPIEGELSYGVARAVPQIRFYTYNPDDLVARRGIETYERMLLDETVRADMRIRAIAPITEWTIQAAGESTEEQQQAEFVRTVFARLPGTLRRKLIMLIFAAQSFGYTVAEKVYEVIEEGEFAGFNSIRDLKVRRSKYFSFDVDERGNPKLDGLIQRISGQDLRLPTSKFVIYAWDKEADDADSLYGRSVLRAVHRAWWEKDTLQKFEVRYLEQFGSPTVKGMYPAGTPPEKQDEFREMLESIQQNTVLTFSDEFTAELMQVAQQGRSAFEAAIERREKAIDKGLLGQTLAVGEGTQGVGSYAMARVHGDTLAMELDVVQEDVEDPIVGEQIIKDLIDMNWLGVTKYPQLVLQPMRQEDKKAKAAAITDAKARGAFVVWTLEDENTLRELLDLPPIDQATFDRMEEERRRRAEAIRRATGQGGDEDEQDDQDQDKPDPEEQDRGKGRRFAADNREPVRLTPAQVVERIDLAAIAADLDGEFDTVAERLEGALTFIRDDLIAKVRRDWTKIQDDPERALARLGFDGLGRFRDAIRTHLRRAYNAARETARKDLVRAERFAAATRLQSPLQEPEAALRWLSAKVFWITGIEKEFILKGARGVLVQALKTGATIDEVAFTLRQWFEDAYHVGAVDPAVETAPRVETIIRTNFNDAYNQGRLSAFEDPEVADEIIGYVLTAILDNRTTEICTFLDGKAFRADDPDWYAFVPPEHHQCRTTFAPVFRGEVVDWITDTEKGQALGMMDVGFKAA